jgi:type IV secretion system protein VirD4
MNKQILKWFVITFLTFLLSLVFTCNIVNLIKKQNITINIISILVADNNIIIGSIIVFILTMLVIINYSIVIQNSIRKGNLKSAGNNEFGSSRFATEDEIKKEFKVWSLNRNMATGGMVVTKIKDKYYYDDSSNHSLIIGSTGSGKTVSSIMPLIYNLADASESMIINDSKGEILRETYGYLKDKNYKIKIINLREPDKSDGWNPLHLPYKYFENGDIEKEVESVNDFSYSICQEVSARDPYWSESSSAVLSGLALGLILDSQFFVL